MSSPQPPDSTGSNKRRRLEASTKAGPNQTARRRELEEQTDTNFYDPDQDENTKRETTRQLRELNATLTESRAEYLQRGSKGIQNTLKKADELIQDVKQTSTATLDSRLLVNIGDITHKKISTMTVGDTSTAIDVDDFLTKCINYMRKTGPAEPDPTQRRRNQQRDNDDDEDEGIAELDWSHLGRTLCFPASRRPCLSSFLLGPLSTQKKQRAQTQRRATQRARPDPSQAARAIRLDEEALDKKESASLTQVCSEIASLLRKAEDKGTSAVEAEVAALGQEEGQSPPEDEVKAIMRRNNIADNGGIPLFNFCINPKSFSQTIENFFYVSFLVKEGKVGIDEDEDGMPTLATCEAKTLQERQESVKNQAVFTLDHEIYQALVESCGIEKSIIPHRQREAWEDDDGVIRSDMADQRPPDARSEDGDQPESSGSRPTQTQNAVDETDDEDVEEDDMYGGD